MTIETRDLLSVVAVAVSFTTFLANWTYQRRTKRLEMTLGMCNLLLGRLDQIETLSAFSSSKPIDQWTEAEQKIARDISGAFHLVGVLAEEGLLPSKLLNQIFYYSIPRARKLLHPYLVSIRSERGASYWGGFDLLAVPASPRVRCICRSS